MQKQPKARVAEYEYYEMDVDRYLKRVGLSFADVERTLHITAQQLTLWRNSKRLPVPVWQRAAKWWGDQGMRPAKPPVRVEFKPFMLDAVTYGTVTPAPLVISPEVPSSPVVEEAPLPSGTTTSDPMVLAIDALARFAASIMAEKALLVKENFRLQRLITLLQQDGETAGDLTALDATTAKEPASATVVAPTLAILKKTVSDPALLRSIEERLPFVLARS